MDVFNAKFKVCDVLVEKVLDRKTVNAITVFGIDVSQSFDHRNEVAVLFEVDAGF